MKKILSLIMIVALLLTVSACGSSGGTAQTTGATEAKKSFTVGYSKVNITPDFPTGLAGYGNHTERKHTEVLDYLFLTCVAITDEADNTLLMYAADLCSIDNNMVGALRTKISGATGVPNDHIHFNASHTHSAPRGEHITEIMNKAVITAAEEALADRKPAQMFAGTANTDGINFVRHYVMNDGSIVTDNHGTAKGKTYASHATEADEEMRVLQFKREGGKDVVMVSWQSHPHITGGSVKTVMSADVIGAFRTCVENDLDCLFAYYQGGAGNINPTSRIKEENANPEKDWKVHGQLLAKTAQEALSNMTQLQTGTIKVTSEIYDCPTNKEEMDRASDAASVKAYYEEGHTISETASYALANFGINSIYHANAISSRGSLGDSIGIELSAVSFGDFGWTMVPYELFDASAKYVRDNSPYQFTFATGYGGGGFGYMPTEECWGYGAYEVDTTKFARGSAEVLAERLVEMLNELCE